MQKEKKPSRSKSILKILAVVVVIAAVLKLYPLMAEYTDSSKAGFSVLIIVEDGATVSSVAQMLEDKGVLRSKWTFILKQKFNSDIYQSVYSGEYIVQKGNTLTDIMKKLMTPPEQATVTLMIPEGFSAEMIALRCENLGLCTQAEFLSALDDEYDYEFIKYIPDGKYKYKLQGFLFPNTYEFFADATAHDIIDRLLAYFQNAYSNNFDSYDDLFENVTIASLIEREAALDSERATISGVIHNRMAVPMPLQIDASAVYAVSDGLYDIEVITGAHMKVDSGYNTYKVQGLPLGPICSPGLKSIIAAANPEAHSYLYYHTDTAKNDGSHIFTETYDAHVATMN